MKREYWVGAILGLFLLAYVLEAVANPLQLNLPPPMPLPKAATLPATLSVLPSS